MVKWYIFDIRTFLIIIWLGEFFSLREVGSTYSDCVVSWWCGRFVDFCVFFSSTQQIVYQSYDFILVGR